MGLHSWVFTGAGEGHGHDGAQVTSLKSWATPGPHSAGVHEPIVHDEDAGSQVIDVLEIVCVIVAVTVETDDSVIVLVTVFDNVSVVV